MSDAAHTLKRETIAAKRLLQNLRETGDADDQEIVESAVEGETNLYEAIASVMTAAIEAAMVEAEQRNIRLDSRTVYLSKVAPKVVVENEAEIPSRFWTTPEPPAPKLDKKALKDALAAKEAVPGARLDNGSISLRMRS